MTSSSVTSTGDATSSSSTGSATPEHAAPSSISIHTVKNNLQVLHSLCSLHGRSISDKAALGAFSRVRGGLLLLSDAYDLLHRSEHGDEIPLGTFLPRVISRIAALHLIGSAPLRATASIPDIPVPFPSAVSWALLLNEIIAYLASSFAPQGYPPELSANGALTDTTLAIACTLPAASGARSTGERPELGATAADIGGVGTALLRQCEATVTWTSQTPPTLEVHFLLPSSAPA